MNLRLPWHGLMAGLVCLSATITLPAEPGLTQPPTNSWIITLGRHNESSPALDPDGNIYVTAGPGKLWALNPDGSPRWVYSTDFEIASTPAIGTDGAIYFGCRNRRLYAVAADGKLRWSFKTGGWVDASPALGADGTIFFGSWDKQFYALDATGAVRWKFPTGGPITSSAAIDADGGIYVGSHDRKLYALRSDGTKRWEFATGGAILSSPALGVDGTVYFTSTDGNLYALTAAGTVRWKRHTGGITAASPVLGVEGNVYVAVNTNHCEFSAMGELLWQRNLSPGGFRTLDWQVTTPVALENNLVFTAGTDLFLCIFARGGGGLWHQSLGTAIHTSPVVTSDGIAYAGSDGLGFHAFKGMPRPANSSWPMFRANPQRTGRVSGRP